MELKSLLTTFIALAFSPAAFGQEKPLPAVQINGNFYGYTEAAQARGAQVSINNNGSYTISKSGKKFVIETNGNGLNAASASLFPSSVLVEFKFKKTIKSGKTLVNDRGPIPTIKIDDKGNGNGNAYINPRDGDQSIEVKTGKKSAKGIFIIKEKRIVECEGKDKLTCSSS